MGNENKMIILNNMYTGRYITQHGKLGHEAINLFKADDGKFYIWLNSMGVCTKSGVEGCTVIMIRSINSHLYKVLAKAENCKLCKGVGISRKKGNKGTDDKIDRYNEQKAMHVTYNEKDPMDDIYDEKDMFATFWTTKVHETKSNIDVYLTNDKDLEDNEANIYYADFKISEAMRAYIGTDHNAHSALSKLLKQKDIWNNITEKNVTEVKKPEFNFFKLLRKERDELSFSNALAYFIGEADKAGKNTFLKKCLNLEKAFLEDDYELLREKNNIDISFFGEKNVIIIENKIDANITVDKRKNLDSQIAQAIDLYFTDISKAEKRTKEKTIKEKIGNYTGDVSQLSKYYIYAVAYLLSKGMDESEIDKHIKCFLLIPEYAQHQFKNKNGYYASPFLLADQYKIITYKDIYNFFKNSSITDCYHDDFISALSPLKNEFNNELEKEMEYEFLSKIGKIQ
ncbi:MAG: PD-(D/E)XK nuclease family protein [Oscillospiraceae bacterium]|nr:PD-(D/E)XK nuclease family protein [Oscillospiraceae bacterium]